MRSPPAPEQLLHRLERADFLDGAVLRLRRAADALPRDARELLGGDSWLGHPLHPMLTDLAIGFWTTSSVLDLVGGKRSARISTAMVGLGIASAVPTAAAGLVDWTFVTSGKKRVGVVHLAANVAATAVYTLSFGARVRGRRGKGVALGLLGATLASAGGYLGGHLAFGTDAAAHEVDPVDRAHAVASAVDALGGVHPHSGSPTEPVVGA